MSPTLYNTYPGFLYRQFFICPSKAPSSLSLQGQTGLVTGANTGLGYQASLQLLKAGLSRLILAVRNVAKGEAARETLLASLAAPASYSSSNLNKPLPTAEVEVWNIDLASYDSITAFVERLKSSGGRVDFAILNAGVASFEYGRNASTGHEASIQVNWLSTALLTLLLTPVLDQQYQHEQEFEQDRSPRRPVISIVSSETAAWAKFKEAQIATRQRISLLDALDDPKSFDMTDRYYTSKLLYQLFFLELMRSHRHNDADSTTKASQGGGAVLNLVNPGFCYGSELHRDAEGALGNVLGVVKRVIGRSASMGARTLVYAAVAAGSESDGCYISDNRVALDAGFGRTEKGREIQRMCLGTEATYHPPHSVEAPQIEACPCSLTVDSTPSPPQLFLYLPDHLVLLCVSCGYALQPHGIPRHLKEIHRLHHSQRQAYLDYASQFPLAEPQNVILPDASQFPVPFLPVIDGLKCNVLGCGHLCATAKRMKAHYASAHHTRPSDGERCYWERVKLQTFFRGNALRYFSGAGYDTWTPTSTSSGSLELNPADSILFTHYVTTTSLTIADALDASHTHAFRVIVPQLALSGQNPFLLHGLLAISALHLAHSDPSPNPGRPKYAIQALHHQDFAFPHFQQALLRVDETNCEAILVFAFVLVVCSLAMEGDCDGDCDGNSDSDGSNGKLFLFPSNPLERNPDAETGNSNKHANAHAIHLLRSGCSMLCTVWPKLEHGPLAPLAHLWREDLGVSTQSESSIRFNTFRHSLFLTVSPSAQSDYELNILNLSTAALALAFAFVEQRGSKFTIWDALNAWPLRVPSGYLDLVQENHPGALLLLAHYSLLLRNLNQAWFFRRHVESLLDRIGEKLHGSGRCTAEIWKGFLDIQSG
ncbi:hypothetical protein BDW66DRAFT_153636 [Aspergillus desertorum]